VPGIGAISFAMVRAHVYFVYILASGRNGTLYVGVTNDLISRVHEHREGLVPGFTKRYGVKPLVYFEEHSDINEAILREKRVKRWRRRWKLALIEAQNPQWRDFGRS
jgi:putative endonuclease